jgi:hypothetical protein
MLLQLPMIKKITAAAIVVVLMMTSAAAGYWLCNRQLEENFLLSNVTEANWQLTFLEVEEKKDFEKAIKFHKYLLEADANIISRWLRERPDLEGPDTDRLRQRIAKYNDEHPDSTVPTLPRPANP